MTSSPNIRSRRRPRCSGTVENHRGLAFDLFSFGQKIKAAGENSFRPRSAVCRDGDDAARHRGLCASHSQKQAQVQGRRVPAAAKRFPKLASRPRHITGTTAGHGPVFQGAYIDAATRPAPLCAAAYVGLAARVSFSIRLRLARQAPAAVPATYCTRRARASAVGASPLSRLDLGHCWWAKSLPRV